MIFAQRSTIIATKSQQRGTLARASGAFINKPFRQQIVFSLQLKSSKFSSVVRVNGSVLPSSCVKLNLRHRLLLLASHCLIDMCLTDMVQSWLKGSVGAKHPNETHRGSHPDAAVVTG